MAEDFLDTHNIRWVIYKPVMSFKVYMLLRSPIYLSLALVSFGLAFWLVDKYFAIIIGLTILFSAAIYIGFLYRLLDDTKVVFEIASPGITIGKQVTSYTSLDKAALISQLQPLVLPYKDWSTPLEPKSDIAILKSMLIFPNQKVRQKAVQSLLYYLGK